MDPNINVQAFAAINKMRSNTQLNNINQQQYQSQNPPQPNIPIVNPPPKYPNTSFNNPKQNMNHYQSIQTNYQYQQQPNLFQYQQQHTNRQLNSQYQMNYNQHATSQYQQPSLINQYQQQIPQSMYQYQQSSQFSYQPPTHQINAQYLQPQSPTLLNNQYHTKIPQPMSMYHYQPQQPPINNTQYQPVTQTINKYQLQTPQINFNNNNSNYKKNNKNNNNKKSHYQESAPANDINTNSNQIKTTLCLPISQPSQIYYCDPCEKEFTQVGAYDAHISTHETCRHPDCKFSGTKKIVIAHFHGAHGLYQGTGFKTIDVEGTKFRVLLGTSPEEVEKWRQARRKKFPCADSIKRKQDEDDNILEAGGIISKPNNNRDNKRNKNDRNKKNKKSKYEPSSQDNNDNESNNNNELNSINNHIEVEDNVIDNKDDNLNSNIQYNNIKKNNRNNRNNNNKSNSRLHLPKPLIGGKDGTLLKKLLENEIISEESIILQCLRFISKNYLIQNKIESNNNNNNNNNNSNSTEIV